MPQHASCMSDPAQLGGLFPEHLGVSCARALVAAIVPHLTAVITIFACHSGHEMQPSSLTAQVQLAGELAGLGTSPSLAVQIAPAGTCC